MSNPKPDYEQLLAENMVLKQENILLRQQLSATGLEAVISDAFPVSCAQSEDSSLPTPAFIVCQADSSDKKIALFMSLFKGRDDIYARRWHSSKSGKSGYSPVCLNEWEPAICDKGKHKCTLCPNRRFAQLDRSAVFAHLSGKSKTASDVIGLYPMTEDECCYFLAIDFDGEDWRRDISAFRNTCTELGLLAIVERSRSGNGGHVWFFFEDKISASTARKFGSVLLTEVMRSNHELSFSSYDRLFPNQDTMPNGGMGNLIALPLQGAARRKGNSVFINECFEPYPDQWDYLSRINKLRIDVIEDYISRICKDSELGVLSLAGQGEEKPWEKVRPQSDLTLNDFPSIVEIIKANMLHINKNGISQKALNRIKRLGAFKNPDFYKAQAMRLPTYNKPRIIDTTEETAEYLSLPRGCEDELRNILDEISVPQTIDDKRFEGKQIKVHFNGELRPEQKIAATALLKYESGVLSATTAFGKTVIGSYIVSVVKVNTLILVHTSALLNQWKESLSQFLTIDEILPEQPIKRGRKKSVSLIGQLGNTKNTLGGIVDVATIQSLVRENEVKELVKTYGLVIVDECHHVSAVTFERVLKSVNAKYVYGLTATPSRQDGQQPIIFMQCGDIRYQVNIKDYAEKSGFERFVVPRFTSFKKPIGVESEEYSIAKIYADLSRCEPRNRLICSDVLNSLEKGRTPIVLTQRSDHVAFLADEIEKHCPNVIRLTGKVSAKTKRELLEQLKTIPKDKQLVIVATGKYVGEGFDEPRLDTLFLAAPISWKGTLQQYTGRLHRSYPGKESVLVYDYVDIHIKTLENMYHKRITGYSTMGYKSLNLSDNTKKAVGIIFDNHDFFTIFENDIRTANHEIVICSPFLRKARMIKMTGLLSGALINGAQITIVTRPSESYKLADQIIIQGLLQSITTYGIKVITKSGIHQKFAIIDRNTVWYGSINLLSYGSSDESIMRFENTEIAEELLATIE